ncbi:MAG: class I SAM-dependent methyltransferase [Clostridiales bacterium]
MNIDNSLKQSHFYIEKIIKPNSILVDATAGNGNDTLFLAHKIGEKGKIYSFDIQKVAIDFTMDKLMRDNLSEKVDLVLDSHENIDKYIKCKIDGAMFNLGYLPSGDHNISTEYRSTIKAIDKLLLLLNKNGIITIVIYHGGDSGFEEKRNLLEYLEKLNNKEFNVMKTEFINQSNHPPILICIEKK